MHAAKISSGTGTYLHRRLLGTVTILLVIGLMTLFSATGVLGLQKHGSEFYFIGRQGFCALTGFFLMVVISRIPYHYYFRCVYPFLLLQLVLIFATVFSPFGRGAQGASRWVEFCGFSFQPSELAKITLSIFLSFLLVKREQKGFSPRAWIFHLTMILLLLSAILFQPDFGTAVLLSTMVVLMLFVAGLRPVYLLAMLGSGTIFVILATASADYRKRRLLAFINPWNDPHGAGFQTIQSFLSFHSGRFFGVGPGNGNSKLFFLPEVHTDFIYALVGEEFGFLGSSFLLIAFIYFLYLTFKISIRAKDAFGKYVACALSLCFFIQLAVNVGGVTGILPVKGLPLPFISWGRTALIANLIMVGILLNISRQSTIISNLKS